MPRIDNRSRQSVYGVALLVYPAALLAAAFDWRWAFAILGLATFPVEALFTRRAPLAYGVLRLADAGRAVRGVARSFGIVLLTAVAFHRTVDIVLVASFMFAIEAARASKELIGIVVPARRRMHMVTRNLDISALRIPDRTVGPVERIDAHTMSYLAVAPLIGVIVSAATDSAVPIVVGALVGAVVGVGIVAVAGTHALAARRMPSRRRVTSVVKDQIAAYAPEVVIYFSGGGTSTYQINMWLEVAAQLDQRVLIILRERAILEDLAPTSLPVLCVPGAVDLMDLDMPTVRVALYAANTGKNIHFLRLPGMAHVFIGHGDSDKVASINPFCKVYDEVWVAGPAGRERFARAMIGVDDRDVFEVGRPQLAPIERGARKTDEPITVLYAPTWEGWTDDPLNTSLITMGRAIVATILDHPDSVRLIYKPHPLTGRRSAKASAENEAIIAMIDKANAARAAGRSTTPAADGTVDGRPRGQRRQQRDRGCTARVRTGGDRRRYRRRGRRRGDDRPRLGRYPCRWRTAGQRTHRAMDDDVLGVAPGVDAPRRDRRAADALRLLQPHRPARHRHFQCGRRLSLQREAVRRDELGRAGP